jgi:hypothetical protein
MLIISYKTYCDETKVPFDSHTAELVLSFATYSVLPALVSSYTAPLLLQWVACTLPLLELIGQTVSPMMIDKLQPVFSSRIFEHFYLAQKTSTRVRGRKIVCSNDCTADLGAVHKRNHWIVTCKGCNFTTMYRDDQRTIAPNDQGAIEEVPGLPDYIKTPYPPWKMPLEWQKPIQQSNQSAPLTISRSVSADSTTTQNSGFSGPSPVAVPSPLLQPAESETPIAPILGEEDEETLPPGSLPMLPRVRRLGGGKVIEDSRKETSEQTKKQTTKRFREDCGEDPKSARKKLNSHGTESKQSMFFACEQERYC